METVNPNIPMIKLWNLVERFGVIDDKEAYSMVSDELASLRHELAVWERLDTLMHDDSEESCKQCRNYRQYQYGTCSPMMCYDATLDRARAEIEKEDADAK